MPVSSNRKIDKPISNQRGRMVTLSMSEIISEVEEKEDWGEKVEYLKKHDSKALRELFRIAYADDVRWRMPPGIPPFRALEEWRGGHGHLVRQIWKLGPFLHGTGEGEGISELQRERLFISTLEYLDEKDAHLLCHAKDGEIPGVEKTLAAAAFPETFSD